MRMIWVSGRWDEYLAAYVCATVWHPLDVKSLRKEVRPMTFTEI